VTRRQLSKKGQRLLGEGTGWRGKSLSGKKSRYFRERKRSRRKGKRVYQGASSRLGSGLPGETRTLTSRKKHVKEKPL